MERTFSVACPARQNPFQPSQQFWKDGVSRNLNRFQPVQYGVKDEIFLPGIEVIRAGDRDVGQVWHALCELVEFLVEIIKSEALSNLLGAGKGQNRAFDFVQVFKDVQFLVGPVFFQLTSGPGHVVGRDIGPEGSVGVSLVH